MPDTDWQHYMTKRPLPTYAERSAQAFFDMLKT